MAYFKWAASTALFISTILLAVLNVRKSKEVEELRETVDYLTTRDHELVIVVDENLKSKQDRTRIKIEDIIASNHYVTPAYSLDNLARIVVKYSERYSVPVNLMLAIMTTESAFNNEAVSPVGAVGLMQVMPGTAVSIAAELGAVTFDPFALDDAVRFGTYYLRKMLKTFNGDIELSVRAYNAGPQNIAKGLYPGETVAYHKSVMGVYQQLEERH
jgi:soluble lytic murein transglycosylase-like protein